LDLQEILQNEDQDHFEEDLEERINVEEEEDTASEDDTEEKLDPEEEDLGLHSHEELSEAYKKTERLIRSKEQEVADLHGRLEAMEAQTNSIAQVAQEDAFMRELQESYEKDPLATTAMLFEKARQEAMYDLEARMHKVLENNRMVDKLLKDFINEPENAALKPYRKEIEDLVVEKGFSFEEAADIINRIQAKLDQTSRKRSAAAKEIRKRSTVESGGEPGNTSSKDKDFDRVLKKSKTLDEMFAGLRKLQL
jgi:hypothetical protein